MSDSPVLDYAKADEKKLAEIIRQAEARLDAQLQVGTAADQRAMTFAGMLAAVLAALIALAPVQHLDGLRLVALACVMCGIGVSALLAAMAAQPRAWNLVGSEPNKWIEDIAQGDSLHNGMAAMARYYDDMIVANHASLLRDANWLRAATSSTIVTLLVAGGLTLATA